jgi:hypothetical protein
MQNKIRNVSKDQIKMYHMNVRAAIRCITMRTTHTRIYITLPNTAKFLTNTTSSDDEKDNILTSVIITHTAHILIQGQRYTVYNYITHCICTLYN